MNFVGSYRAARAHPVDVEYEIQSVKSGRNQKLLTNEVSFLRKFTPQTQLDLTRDGVFVWEKTHASVLYAGWRASCHD